MIKPHGSDKLNPLFVQDDNKRAALLKEAEGLPSIVISSAAAGNAVMLGAGYFNPLTGYMNLADSLGVAEKMKMTSGLFWPVPIINMVKDASAIKGAKQIALKDPNVEGNPIIAIQTVEKIETVPEDKIQFMAEKIFRTLDPKHPGVAAFTSVGNTLISGPITVLSHSYFEKDFPEAAVVTLEENWRSSGAILKAAGSLIKHNVKRKEKELVATHPPGRPPTLIEAADEEDEAIQIADAINGLTRERVAPSDIAVFYRTNAQSRSLETAFMAKTVPYVVVGAVVGLLAALAAAVRPDVLERGEYWSYDIRARRAAAREAPSPEIVIPPTVVEVIDMIRRLELYNFAINVEYEAPAP